MKTIILFIIFAVLAETANAQYGTGFQTYKSVMKISAFKDGVNHQWENKNITVAINYQTGRITVKLTNRDFYQNSTSETVLADSIVTDTEYTISGILPTHQIKDQLQINQKYVVELQLSNYEQTVDNTINFDLNVTNPGTSQVNYRIFLMQGKMYNEEMQLPAFVGFDNEIDLYLSFSGYMTGN